jgi:hypothetical protein
MPTRIITVDTTYGQCKVRENHYINGVSPTIQTAINKNSYFSNMAKEVHNGLYCYDRVNYVNAITKIEIKCRLHGIFTQTPNHHLHGRGCPKCKLVSIGLSKRNTQDDFVNKSNIKHNFKYDYSNSVYKLQHNPVDIICPIHGEFSIVAKEHLSGHGCTLCGRESISKHRSE